MDSQQSHIFRCKGCRQNLFRNLVHGENQDCTSLFIEKPNWLNIDDLEN